MYKEYWNGEKTSTKEGPYIWIEDITPLGVLEINSD